MSRRIDEEQRFKSMDSDENAQFPSNTFLDTDKEEVLTSREEQEFHMDEMKASLRIK